MEAKEELTAVQKAGRFLKEKREAKGWGLRRLAIELYGNDDQRSYLSQIEKGLKPNVAYETIVAIAKALNTDVNFNEN